jgi:hypothetical protein
MLELLIVEACFACGVESAAFVGNSGWEETWLKAGA